MGEMQEQITPDMELCNKAGYCYGYNPPGEGYMANGLYWVNKNSHREIDIDSPVCVVRELNSLVCDISTLQADLARVAAERDALKAENNRLMGYDSFLRLHVQKHGYRVYDTSKEGSALSLTWVIETPDGSEMTRTESEEAAWKLAARDWLNKLLAERDAALAQVAAMREALELAHTRLRLAAWADKTMEEIEAAEDDEEEPSGIAELNQAVIDKIEAALANPAPRVYTRAGTISAFRWGYDAGVSAAYAEEDCENDKSNCVETFLARLDVEGEARHE